MESAPPRPLTLEPIGYLRTGAATKVEAPRQPRAARGVTGRIELLPGRHYEHALLDLERWSHIWVLFWFDRNEGWRPKVLPPRSRTGRKGVFATRAPHRPNPLGLSALRLERIEGLTLHVRDVDLLDGTPVLDIKPYVPYTDAIAEAGSGWLDDAAVGASADPVPAFIIDWSAHAAEQAAWVEAQTGLALRSRADAILQLGAEPHPYRRIRRRGAEGTLALKEWRLRFEVQGRSVMVHSVASGFRPAQLAVTAPGAAPAPRIDPVQLDLHRQFNARFEGAALSGSQVSAP